MSSIVIISIVVAASVITGIVSTHFWGSNNPVEQDCEEVIKEETGIDLNLSPGATPPASTITPNSGNKASS